MSDFTILVTAVGGDIGVNIVRCLSEGSYRTRLLGCDADPYAFGRKAIPTFLQCPRASQVVAYRRFIEGVIRDYKIKYIFPGSESEIMYFHEHRTAYEQQGIELMVNHQEVLKRFLDKHLTAVFLREHNLPYPKTFLLEDYTGGLDFPVILKRRRGSGSKLVLIVKNQWELDFYKNKYSEEDLIVQEYLGTKDEEYTGGVFSDGRQTFSILFRRYLAADAGITLYAELVNNQTFTQLANRIADACYLEGSINIQLRKVGEEFIPFEINPRISGTAFIRHRFGFKDVEWWLDMKRGIALQYCPKYRRGGAVRAVSEVFLDLC